MQTTPKTYTTSPKVAKAYLHAICTHNSGHTLTPAHLAKLMSIEVSTARYLLDRVIALHRRIERGGGVGMLISTDGEIRLMLAPHPDK